MTETPSPRGRRWRPGPTSTGADVALGVFVLIVLAGFFVCGEFGAAMEKWARSYDGLAGQEEIRRIRQQEANSLGYLMATTLGLAGVAVWARRRWTAGLMVVGMLAFVVLLGLMQHANR
ncbi:DUF6234 family protein [Kitasatospora sp. NPDC047058]|uniref:DUF6234 family protein n=1 Tax=Kitasatospora sp. NPDC047058 TaxID=3155620 RepID=UPI0033DB3CEF